MGRNQTYPPAHSSPFSRLVDRGTSSTQKGKGNTNDIIGFSLEDFDSCLHLCRTSSRSVKHGNEYKSVLKYCYSEKLDYTDPILTLSELTSVVAAPVGQSCNDLCIEKKLMCVDEYLQNANDCTELQKYFNCQQCLPAMMDNDGNYPPAPAWLTTPLYGYTSQVCLVQSDYSSIECKTSHPSIQRLCVCLPPS
jgi:hypothetical protein